MDRWTQCSLSRKWAIRCGRRRVRPPPRWIGATRSGSCSNTSRRTSRLRRRFLWPRRRSPIPRPPPTRWRSWIMISTIIIVSSGWIIRIRRLRLIPTSTAPSLRASSIWLAPSLLNGSLSKYIYEIYFFFLKKKNWLRFGNCVCRGHVQALKRMVM